MHQTLRLALAAGTVPATRGSGVVRPTPRPAERLRPQPAGTVPGRPRTRQRYAKVHGTQTRTKKMATPQSQEQYKKRRESVERVFAVIKHCIGVRQVRTRGIKNVRTEWLWISLAFNLQLKCEVLSTGDRQTNPAERHPIHHEQPLKLPPPRASRDQKRARGAGGGRIGCLTDFRD
ncbi:MAG: transposase [Planctomycetota bacterium]